MNIDILANYGMDLTEDSHIEKLLSHILTISDSVIELNFDGCILDYPITSKIIDSAIDTLTKSASRATLVLLFNIHFQEHMFIKWFFFGGKLLPKDQYNADVKVLHDLIHGRCLN